MAAGSLVCCELAFGVAVWAAMLGDSGAALLQRDKHFFEETALTSVEAGKDFFLNGVQPRHDLLKG